MQDLQQTDVQTDTPLDLWTPDYFCQRCHNRPAVRHDYYCLACRREEEQARMEYEEATWDTTETVASRLNRITMHLPGDTPRCPHCDKPALLTGGRIAHWYCPGCDADEIDAERSGEYIRIQWSQPQRVAVRIPVSAFA